MFSKEIDKLQSRKELCLYIRSQYQRMVMFDIFLEMIDNMIGRLGYDETAALLIEANVLVSRKRSPFRLVKHIHSNKGLEIV